ncbi:alpha-N-acetylgalactosamine-specific lectin-like [Branchiostoma floridae x Branchiostoma japonicum]
MSTTIDVLKRNQYNMYTTADALKRDLDKGRSRTVALEQRLHEMMSCPEGYAEFRGICYKAFSTRKTFSDAAAACGEKGGTLAMPRDAETNAFLISLHDAVSDNGSFWFGLHDQAEEGSFDWMDGSPLGTYNSWAPGQPDNVGDNQDCVTGGTITTTYSGSPTIRRQANKLNLNMEL